MAFLNDKEILFSPIVNVGEGGGEVSGGAYNIEQVEVNPLACNLHITDADNTSETSLDPSKALQKVYYNGTEMPLDNMISVDGIITIEENGSHDVSQYKWAEVYVQPKLQEKSIDPKTESQEVTADSGYDGLSKLFIGAVTSEIDENIKAENIKNGVTILGVTGTMEASSGGSSKFGELVDGSITSVEEADLANITEIRESAFVNCSNLTSAVVPSNVTTIGANAFSGCTSLQTLILAEGVTTIGANAFNGINASSIEIPSSVTSLGESAFANNTALTNITIPSGITELTANLFNGCTSLTEITMEATTPPTLGANVFPDNVVSIYVPYSAYDAYVSSWSAYADKIVRLPAKPSTITVTVNNYLGELVSGASVTITGNNQTYTGTTDSVGVFSQGDLQPATYTISVADLEGFKTPDVQEVVVEEDTQNGVTITYLEKPAFEVDPVLSNNSPATISAVSALISANNMTSAQVEETFGWKIGDTTIMPTTAYGDIPVRIDGYNHDNKSDGSGKVGITFEATVCVSTGSMNGSSTNRGGYPNSTIKNNVLPNIKSRLPQEWQDAIVKVDKKSANGGETYSEIVTTSEDLFLLSAMEVLGFSGGGAGAENEGTQYEYYKTNSTQNARVKKYNNSAKQWWLRSCASYDTSSFLYIKADGGNSSNGALNSYGVSFAFCV